MADEIKQLTVGDSLAPLDIFLQANGVAIDAKTNGVGAEIFDAANVSTASGVALNPQTGKYTASGTIPAGFQLGTWRVDWTIVTAADELLTASENFRVNSVNVQVGFVDSADKTGSIYDAVRLDIGDPDGAVFDDGFLSRVLIKAVRRLNHRLGLAPSFRGPTGIPGNFGGRRIKVLPITLDIAAGTLTPNNDEYCDLAILMMEYIIVSSETTALKRLQASATSGPYLKTLGSAEQDGISVTNADGVTVNISGGRLANRVALHRLDLATRKEEIETAIREFRSRISGNFGKVVW